MDHEKIGDNGVKMDQIYKNKRIKCKIVYNYCKNCQKFC